MESYWSQIKLVEKDKVLQDDDLIAKELIKLFKSTVSHIKYIYKKTVWSDCEETK